MPKCKGGPSWRPCGASVFYARSSFSVGNIALDVDPSDAGDVVIEEGLAVVLSRAVALAYAGKRFTMHVTTCRNGVARLDIPLFRGGAKQSTKLRPAFEVGEFDSPAERHVAEIEVGALDQEADRLAEKFVEHLHDVRGDREIYGYDEANETFNSFRRLYGIRREVCDAVALKARKRIRVADREAA